MIEGVFPPDFNRALSYVQARFPEAVLAGGCIRDFIMEKSINDIDIFVKSRGPFNSFNGPQAKQATDDYGAEERCSDVEFIETVHVAGCKWPVNVIYLVDSGPVGRDPDKPFTTTFFERVLNRMDLGFCKAGYDGERVLYMPEFHTDLNNGVITVNGELEEWRRDGTAARVERFTGEGGKYEGWRVLW